MKPFNQAKKYGRKVFALVPASVVAFGMSSAQAAIDISAETAEAKGDVSEAGALIVGVVVAIAVIAWIRKVIH